jgi:hypothetical protein
MLRRYEPRHAPGLLPGSGPHVQLALCSKQR